MKMLRKFAVMSATACALTLAACKTDCPPIPPLAEGELPAPKVLPNLVCNADKNDSQLAQLYLGLIYEDGDKGVPADLPQAAHWYERAARARLASGPPGVYMPPVTKGGVGSWLPLTQTPGNNGEPLAQYRLGLMYRDGRGVPRDLAKAREYLQKAADQRYPRAEEALRQLPGS